MAYSESIKISYEKYGAGSCILEASKAKMVHSIRIPEKIDGLTVVGFNAKFIKSEKKAEYIYLSRYVSKVDFIGNDLGTYLKDSLLSEIEVDPSNPYFKSIDGVLFSRDGRTLVFYPPAKSETSYIIPDEVEYISKYAFIQAGNLKTLTFGKNVKSLREFTLCSCSGLMTVNILGRETVITGNPFQSCCNISHIEFPNGSFIYKLRNGVLYTEMRPGRYMLWLFPPAMKLENYVVASDTFSISYSAMYFLLNINKVYIPKRCKLPFVVKGISFSFYEPLRPPVEEDKKSFSSSVDSIDDVSEKYRKDGCATYKTAIDRIFDEFVDGHTLKIPNYRVYSRIEKSLLHHLPVNITSLLESITTIHLPDDMATVNREFFFNFVSLSELQCTGTGVIHVKDNVLYNGNRVVYYPPCCKSKALMLKRPKLHIENEAFAYNKYLENLVIDSSSTSIGIRAFEYAQCLSNVIINGNLNGLGSSIFYGIKNEITVFVCGKIKECCPSSFSELKGSVDILLLRMTDKYYLQKILKRGPYVIQLSTPKDMARRFDEISRRYGIDIASLPRVEEKHKEPNIKKVEKLPRNVRVEIKVMGHRFACMNNGHHLETKAVSVDMIDNNRNYRTMNLNVGYCRDCKNYFVYSNVFKEIRDKIEYSKWKLIGVNFYEPGGRSYGYILESVGELRKESILKICGYSVGQSSNLSAAQRMNILTGIIKRNWLTKQGVMSYLNWFIDFHGHNSSMTWAVRDWKYDLRALQNMTI